MIRVSLCDNGDDQTKERIERERREEEKEAVERTVDQKPIKMHGASSSPIPIAEAFGDAYLHADTCALALNHCRNIRFARWSSSSRALLPREMSGAAVFSSRDLSRYIDGELVGEPRRIVFRDLKARASSEVIKDTSSRIVPNVGFITLTMGAR